MVQLTGYELHRATSHPAFLAALAPVILGWFVPWIADRSVWDLKVVNLEAVAIQVWLLLPAAGAFLGASLIGVADHRFGSSEMLSVAPVPEGMRLGAQAAASVGPAAAVLGITLLRLWAVSTAPGAAGRPPLVGDILTPAAVTLLAATVATCCAHLSNSLAVCGVVLAVLGVITVVGAFAAYGTSSQGLFPIMLLNPFAEPPVPTSLLTRPADLHAVWLAALAVLVLAATMMLRRVGGRAWLILGVVAGLVAGASGYGQVENGRQGVELSSAWEALYRQPRHVQRCEVVGSDTYCAFPEFASRIPYWRDVVSAQKALLPAAGTKPIRVRQRLSPRFDPAGGSAPTLPWDAWRHDEGAADSTEAVPVSTRWARPGSDEYAQNEVLGFAVLSAATLVGWTLPSDQTPRRGEVCGAQGVLTAWLATQSSPAVASAYQVVSSHISGAGIVEVAILGVGRHRRHR